MDLLLCACSFPFFFRFKPFTSSSPFFHLPSFLAHDPFKNSVYFLCENLFGSAVIFYWRGIPEGFSGAFDIMNLDFGWIVILFPSSAIQ